MSASFSMDPNWEKKILQAAEAQIRQRATDLQREMDRLRPRYAGKPAAEIKPQLQRVWTRATEGGSITEPQLTTYAEAISSGRKITFQYKGVK